MSVKAAFHFQWPGFTLDVDLSLPPRGVTGIFGPSGSGKTSLLRAIAGLDRHAGGQLSVDGSVWQSNQVFIPPHRRALGFVFQQPALFEHLDVLGNLEYGYKRVPTGKRRIELHSAIEMLGLSPLLKRRTSTLSGGETQRVAIARALATSPQLLLMDEPLAALDRRRREEILPYLESLHDELEIPLLYVSHSPEEIARLADHLVMLEGGRVTAAGEPQALFSRLDLSLAHESDAATVIEAVVESHDETFQLTELSFAGGSFRVAQRPLEPGSRARLRLAARDVSLTLNRQTDTSILNIFAATVEAISDEGNGQVTVRLLASGVPILSRITKKSAHELNLKPGQQVFAQVKGVAFLT